MATVSERVYSELPDQPQQITEAFNLNQAVPSKFCTKFLEQHVTSQNVLNKQEHDLTHSNFIIDPFNRVKKLPKFNKRHKKLTAKERRKLRLSDIPKDVRRYSTFLDLHYLWKDYMGEVLRFDRPTFNIANKGTRDVLLRADYHGCIMRVVQSKCPTYVGVCGIVMQETREVFKLINEKNIVKAIPKKTSIFAFRLGNFEVKIHGKNFNYRPMDRVNKKFKAQCKSLDI